MWTYTQGVQVAIIGICRVQLSMPTSAIASNYSIIKCLLVCSYNFDYCFPFVAHKWNNNLLLMHNLLCNAWGLPLLFL